jgi:hypothetical protein
MADSQLLDYIRQRLVTGTKRAELSKELIGAGWPPAAVNEALAELKVPFDGAPTAPQMPPQYSAAMGNHQNPPAYGSVPPVTGSLPPTHSESHASGSRAHGSMPGVFALLTAGYNAYIARLGTYVGMGAIMAIAMVAAPFALILGGTLFLKAASGSVVAMVIGAVIAGALGVLLISWVSLAFLHLVRGHEESLSISGAFGRATKHVLPVLWVAILLFFVFFGASAVLAGIPAAVIGFGGSALMPGSMLPGIVAVVYGMCAVLGVILAIGVWATFANWLVLDDAFRGTQAIAASRMLVRSAGFGSVLWRTFGTGFIIGLVSSIVHSVISVAASSTVGSLIAQALYVLLASAVFNPIYFVALFALYRSARDVSPEPVPQRQGMFIGAATAGLVSLIAVPLIAGAFLMTHVNQILNSFGKQLSAGSAQSSSTTADQLAKLHDAIRESALRSLQVTLEVAYGDANRYPADLSGLKGFNGQPPSVTDPFTHQPYEYQVDSAGKSYTLCAALDAGNKFCVDSKGSATTTPL